MPGILHQIHLSGGALETDAEGVVWAPILRECEYDKTPTPKGLVDRPFRVVKDGQSADDENGLTISMSELADNFKAGAFKDNVTIPLTDEPGTDHKKDVARFNTGFVTDLKVEDGPDGKSRLMAAHNFTNDDVKKSCLNGSIRNRSAAIYVNPLGDGLAVKHVAPTNTPFMSDLDPWAKLALSDDQQPDQIVAVNLADDGSLVEPAADEEQSGNEVVWSETNSVEWLRGKVSAHFRQLAENARKLTGDEVYYWVRDIAHTSDKALVQNESTSDTYVVPFTVADDEVEVAGPEKWVEAEQVMVAASDDAHIVDQLRVALSNEEPLTRRVKAVELLLDIEGKDVKATFSGGAFNVPKPDENRSSESEVSPVVEASDEPEVGSLAWASRQRELRLSQSSNPAGGAAMPREGSLLEKLKAAGVELSGDALVAVEQTEQRAAKADELEAGAVKSARETSADQRIEKLKEVGFSSPGVLKKVRTYLVSDDGATAAVVELSDDNGNKVGEKGVTLSEAVNDIVDALIASSTKDDQGRLLLSEQVPPATDHERPRNDGGDEKPLADRVAAAREALGKKAPGGDS